MYEMKKTEMPSARCSSEIIVCSACYPLVVIVSIHFYAQSGSIRAAEGITTLSLGMVYVRYGDDDQTQVIHHVKFTKFS